jgi:hypothetical protein
MVLKRYIVEVDSEQVLKLSPEQVELATQISNGPTKLLIFRDRFVACKIATRSGGTFYQGYVVDGDALQGDPVPGGIAFGNGMLMLDTVAEA